MTNTLTPPTDFMLEDSPFEYAKDGDMVLASFITFLPPTSRHLSLTSDLKQYFFRALPQGSQEEDANSSKQSPMEDELEKLDGDAIMMQISMSHSVELKSVLATARELFCQGLALIDGETKITKPVLDTIDPDQFESMVGFYYRNFILASWLKKVKKLL